ncbi:MAG TPA: ABC transporter substrate-binding protein [Coleofasciculaceae cyanobacterium]
MLKFKIHRLLQSVALAVATLVLLIACNTQPSSTQAPSAKPLVVASSPWPGFIGHYIAVAKDFFTAEGITVEDRYFQVATDANTALLSGKVDLGWTGVPDLITMTDREPSLKLIMLSDYSNGADGILARGITDPKELRGKQIAWEGLPLQAVLLKKYLQSGGLSEKDVKLLNIPAAEAASAFAAQKVDVAVTYEPWLTKASKAGQGQIIFSSKDTNLIADGLAAQAAVLKSRQSDVLAYLRAVDKGVQFAKSNPQEAAALIAQKLGVTAEEVPALLATVRLFGIQDNQAVAFNPSDRLNVIDSIKFAAITVPETGSAPKSLDPTTLYDDALIKQLSP